jgi:sterol desaturase/sphingolipid hydroxylase (fatty acid hydroxylase superfamily)
LAGLRWTTGQFLAPVASSCAVTLVTAFGGGFIPLRSDGWWYFLSFLFLILAMDFWAYLIHRAQHKFSVLWAMHSLHHSAESLSVVTGARHFWLEEFITTAFFPVVWIVFKVPVEMVTPMALLYIVTGEALSHLNMRLSLGWFSLVFNNPQYHRIHHSVEPRHQNKNFSKLLPVFDVIFGTAWKPGKNEFPKTGLVSRERATGFTDGLIWPLRKVMPLVTYRAAGSP